MDGAASVFAAVSIALQLVESMKKLRDFWKSVQEAPQDVRNIITDLDLLTAALCEIALDAQRIDPDATLGSALRSCEVNTTILISLLNELQPGFASGKRAVRKWTAIKSTMKWDKIKKFQTTLERLKSTLMLIRQNQISRYVRLQTQEQQNLLLAVYKHMSRLQVSQTFEESSGASSSTSINQTSSANCSDKTSPTIMTASKCNNRVEIGRTEDRSYTVRSDEFNCEVKIIDEAVDAPAVSEKPKHSQSGTFSRHSLWTKRHIYGYQNSIDSSFGSFEITSNTSSLQLNVKSPRMNYAKDYEPREIETCISIRPAPWLRKVGIMHGLSLRLVNSSFFGWKQTLSSFRLVPDDAMIFRLCWEGNLPAVRQLLIDEAASVNDVQSTGVTPLHVAAGKCHVELCKFLIEYGADTDTASQTSFEFSGENDVIDTCRLFLDFLDFSEENLWILIFMLSWWGVPIGAMQWFLRQVAASGVKINLSEELYTAGLICFAGFFTAEITQLWLKVGPERAIDSIDYCGNTALLGLITRGSASSTTLLQLGADPNQLAMNHISSRLESPTSWAMYSSFTFSAWRSSLLEGGIDIEVFLEREIHKNLIEDHDWTLDALQKLFNWNFEACGDYSKLCSDCDKRPSYHAVQPFWLFSLEQIKNGQAPGDTKWEKFNPSNLDMVDDLEFDNRCDTPIEKPSFPYSKDEFCCFQCWDGFRRTEKRRIKPSPKKSESGSEDLNSKPDEEYSPLHIHF